MEDPQRKSQQGDRSVYVEQGNVVIQYGHKEILKFLGSRPNSPDAFMGRDEQLERFEGCMWQTTHLPQLLVNAEGGIGKTTFAAAYYLLHRNDYVHLVWVYAESGIANSLLGLSSALQISYDNDANDTQRLALFLDEFRNLRSPSLLVIDNANDPEDLNAYNNALRQLPNMHVLITSRVMEVDGLDTFPLPPLERKFAVALFKKHFPAHAPNEDALLDVLLPAVGYNTLVIELLAKNLSQFHKTIQKSYNLTQLVEDLGSKGLFGIQGKLVSTTYQARGFALRKESPEEILSVMYKLGELPDEEQALMSVLSVLPAESISYRWLEALIPSEDLDTTLLSLAQKGWLDYQAETTSFKVSPVVQQVTRKQNQERLFADAEPLIVSLIEKLDYDGGHITGSSYADAAYYARLAETVSTAFSAPSHQIAILCERLGNYHQTLGDLGKALGYFEEDLRLSKELHVAYPEKVSFKNGLAITYSKLGETYTSLGDLSKALGYYEEQNRLVKELHAAYPDNVGFKNGLAVSNSKLGETYTALGDLGKALKYFEERNRLGKELHAAYPDHVGFKNGLAVSNSKLGNTYAALGDLGKALGFYEKYNHLSKELHATYPDNVGFKNGLAISNSKLGETHTALGDLSKALGYFEEDLRLSKELHAAYPDNVDFKDGLAISYEKLGQTHAALGDLGKALGHYNEQNRLGKELHAAYPDNVDFKNGLAISFWKLGDLARKMNDLAKARNYFSEAQRLWEALVLASPQNVQFSQYRVQVRRDLERLAK